MHSFHHLLLLATPAQPRSVTPLQTALRQGHWFPTQAAPKVRNCSSDSPPLPPHPQPRLCCLSLPQSPPSLLGLFLASALMFWHAVCSISPCVPAGAHLGSQQTCELSFGAVLLREPAGFVASVSSCIFCPCWYTVDSWLLDPVPIA